MRSLCDGEPAGPCRRNEPVSVCTCEGAVHVPGVPGVNGANAGLLMSAMYTFDGPENSAGARMIPVAQSSPEESSSPPAVGTVFS